MVTPDDIKAGSSRSCRATSSNWTATVSISKRSSSARLSRQERVQQHQLVYDALGDRMHAEIHALSMKTFTPKNGRQAEWINC